tara:strand:- start:1236 stop:2723 length:1488 start_codon:yes stop_codon:yes gene_type:complete
LIISNKARVRYAPSPTGEPHLGNIRTAIFDWLLARHTNGKFIVRIEDTDQARIVDGAIDLQKQSLEWLGLDWDEGLGKDGSFGPYVQSERLDYYNAVIESLIQTSDAYKCYCTGERLAKLREEQKRQKLSRLGYDGKCRGLTEKENTELEAYVGSSVIRFAMPTDGITEIEDMVRGHIEFDNALVDDFILLKADGFPTYHLASVVDDNHMKITHVLRGEEWVSSIPRHIQIYRALGWEPPIYAHLPTILAPDKSKLSKRHGATSVLEYRKMGYLPDAMLNFLSLLGWSLDGETEIIPREDIVKHFDPNRINVAGAVFDIEKLDWMNGYYIRNMEAHELGDVLFRYWQEFPPKEFERLPSIEESRTVAFLVRERLKRLNDAAPLVAFIFRDSIDYDEGQLIQNDMDVQGTISVLDACAEALSNIEPYSADSIERVLRLVANNRNIKVGQLLGTVRVSTSGQKVSPPLFQSLEILGRERVSDLLSIAKSKLSSMSNY